MQSPCIRQVSKACFNGNCCVLTPFLGLPEPTSNSKSKSSTTTAASRFDFVNATASSLPEIHFTNHECLPSLSESFDFFTNAFPHYTQTDQADVIREQEYYHLSVSNQVCLDYIGLGLFSQHQVLQCQPSEAIATSSSSAAPPPPQNSQFPFFDVCYKTTSLYSQILYGGQESEFESSIRKRIMENLNICETEYSMVFTANCASALKLLSESYQFRTNKRLLTVYDHERDGIRSMIHHSQKRGAKIKSAQFSWPSMRINSSRLRKMIVSKRKKKKRGLFVFPLQSKTTGARYSYQWMNLAQENGWHVLLDASALGAKEMDTLGLSLFRPDFLVYSFYKVFGGNPSGFGCLFVKRSTASILESSSMARSIGIVNLVPANKSSHFFRDTSGTESETQQPTTKIESEADQISFSGPIHALMQNGAAASERHSSSDRREIYEMETLTPEIVELDHHQSSASPELEQKEATTQGIDMDTLIECRGLDHADSLGFLHISQRARCLTNWLVNALTKLHHPHSEKGFPLVQIYGPKIKFHRGPAVAFNVFDWKGERIDPMLVQKLADRSNVSLSYGFLQNLCFSEKYQQVKDRVLESRTITADGTTGKRRSEKSDTGITVVTASLGFLANFQDTYRLWAFVARFLDADFVEKERWRYIALNQQIVEV